MWFTSKTLDKLLPKVPSHSGVLLTEKVNDIFGDEIAEIIRANLLLVNITPQQLFTETLYELTRIIQLNPSKWKIWTQISVMQWLPHLIKACHWKLCLPTFTNTESHNNGLFLLDGLVVNLEKFNLDSDSTRRKKLATYIEKNQEHQTQIAIRTLRALIPSLRSKANNLYFFDVVENHHIVLRDQLVLNHLYEQLAPYVYIFINAEEGSFLEDYWSQVKSYVRRKLYNAKIVDYEAIASDITQEVMTLFISKRLFYQSSFSQSYIDKSFKSFLIDMIRSHKILTKCFQRHNRIISINHEEMLPSEAEARSKEEAEVIQVMVKACLNTLTKKCKNLLMPFTYQDAPEKLTNDTVSDYTDIPLRTVERNLPLCKKQLQTCLTSKAIQQGIRLF